MMNSIKPFIPYRNPELYQRRVSMLANGWPTINCERKSHVDEGWSTDVIDEDYLKRKHSRKGGSKWTGAGIRLTNGMAVWDFDIKDQTIIDAVFDDLESDSEFGPLLHGALWRTSGGVSWALFMQASEPIAGHHSATFGIVQEDGTITDKAHIEVWGGAVVHYFAACGPHSEGREYEFDGPAPWDTRLDSLPVFDAKQVGRLIDRVEAVLARFLTKIESSRQLTGLRSVYDLTPETEFVFKDRTVTTLAKLEQELQRGVSYGPRGCMSIAEWMESDSHQRCHAYRRQSNGRLTITNFYDDTQHYFVDEEPAPFTPSAETIEILRAMQAATSDAEASASDPEPEAWWNSPVIGGILRDDDPVQTHDNAVAWLLTHMAFYSQAFRVAPGAVSISTVGQYQKPVSISGLRDRMKGYGYELIGPRGGRRFINPVDTWLASVHLISVDGVRMRPEMPWPLMHEERVTLINRYAPPRHPASGGEVRTWLRNNERLFPDPVERAWVLNYVAAKVQRPELRMVGLAMVAHEHGTGRGLFAETLQYLFGERFVVPLRYDDITASPRFNGEVEDRLIVYVNEARNADSNRYGVKTANREALRVFIEPNHRIPQRIEKKGVDVYFTRLALTTLVFANSIRAVPVDEQDRRIAVVINGPQMTASERDEYQAWMLKAENIGALYRFLRAYQVESDRQVFDPYMAPSFVGRDRMIEAGQSDIDRAWAQAIARLKKAADLYAMNQAVMLTRLFMQGSGPEIISLIRNHTYEHGHRIGIKRPVDVNWLTRYGDDKDNRQAVFAHSVNEAQQWTNCRPEQIKAELDKAQKAVDSPTKAVNKLLRIVKPETEDD